MKLPYKTLEKKLFKSGYQYVLGVDEVGMGCLAGPVVVCAVRVTKDFYKKSHPALRGLKESKLLSVIQREKFVEELLKEKDLVYALSVISPKTIDRINIYQATRMGMKRAVERLANSKFETLNPKQTINTKFKIQNERYIILVDGKYKVKKLDMEQRAIVKGDRKIFAIACASIIAKVYRDKMMAGYSKKYPGYGFEKHKGYGTKYHQAQLAALGPCKIHRKSFRLSFYE